MRIYEHVLEEGWVEPGQIVLDPFAGIGGLALEAMRHGLHFRGVELEMRFVDMGQGCDCTGISKADWVRFQGRWDRMRYEGGRHWCPGCLAKAGMIAGEQRVFVRKFKHPFSPLPLPGTERAVPAKMRQAMLSDAAPSASYARNSGKIPCTGAHHYRGNIETWERQGMEGSAVIVQGDSRRLGEVLARARLCLSSPPYIGSSVEGASPTIQRDKPRRLWSEYDYGNSEGQLSNLPDTGFDLALSSPAYAGSDPSASHVQGHSRLDPNSPNYRPFAERSIAAGYNKPRDYGTTEGQLAAMPDTGFEAALAEQGHTVAPERPQSAGEAPQATERACHDVPSEAQGGAGQPVLALSSPVYAGGCAHTGGADLNPDHVEGGEVHHVDYGSEPGQLAQMPEGSFDLAVSSPVYHSNTASDDPDKRGGLYRDSKRRDDKTLTATYSEDGAQLAQMPEGDLAAVISSPPFIGSIHEGGHGIDAKKLTGNKAGPNSQALVMDGYGRESGQLAALPEGDHAEACERPAIAISSPPFLGSLNDGLRESDREKYAEFARAGRGVGTNYGSEEGQLGVMPTGDHAEALEAGAETGRAQACISSPPWENMAVAAGDQARDKGFARYDPSTRGAPNRSGLYSIQYGKTQGQLGSEAGSTFWAASRQILEEVYKILAPGGHAIWVVKMFVRNKKLVDFPGQWEALCQSVGFKTVCKHRAWMNKNAGIVQTTLDGEEVSMEKWFKSFFRRLCESKGSPRIDWELILCMVKE